MQADWQALQPMHFDTSISLATGVSWRSGGGTLEADRLTRSAFDSLGGPGSTETLGSGGNIDASPQATGAAMDSMLTRNALNSGVSILASPTKGVSEFGPKPFFV